MKKDIQGNTVARFAFIVAIIAFVALVALVGAETYVRWVLNQNFSFLGEAGIPALAFLVVGQTSGLLYYLKK